MPEIIVKYDNQVIEKIVTEKRRISIGRTPDNDIVLNNKGVSRKHALIELNDEKALVIDNESLNGTFVNNRKISEEIIKDNDQITIGKYHLTFRQNVEREMPEIDLDGTMVLKTKKHRELLEKDKRERELVSKAGCSILVGEANADISEFWLDKPVVTLGKSKYVNLRIKGFFISTIQAKITREKDGYVLTNLGKKGKTKVNGEKTDSRVLRNDDLIQIGKSVFRFVERT
jgi:pSer/pThr/pTyr-binding forkhead associated (FHA) protein